MEKDDEDDDNDDLRQFVRRDAKMRWKTHVKKKREELGLIYNKMYWFMGIKSALSIHNKLMLYKQILKPVWSCIPLWGCTKQSNIDIIQRFQNKVLRDIVDLLWYVRNADLHRKLQMEMVKGPATQNAVSVRCGMLHSKQTLLTIIF